MIATYDVYKSDKHVVTSTNLYWLILNTGKWHNYNVFLERCLIVRGSNVAIFVADNAAAASALNPNVYYYITLPCAWQMDRLLQRPQHGGPINPYPSKRFEMFAH